MKEYGESNGYPTLRVNDWFLTPLIVNRNAALKKDGAKQIFYPKSNDGWLRTLLVLEGRALDRIMLPWALVTLNAIAWTVIVEEWKYEEWKHIDVSSYESYFGLALNSSLSFLLVFRLNRSAERYWAARTSWGAMVACGRSMVSGVLVHGSHDKENRDAVIKWIASHSVITMHYIRGITNIVPETVSGILGESEIKEMKAFDHPGLFATDQIRWHLKEIFKIDKDTPFGIAQGRSQQLDTLEKQLNKLSLEMGALERIKSTPLPIVYVSHLRTFLLCFLFSLPYIWETALGYATIPLVFVTAFALLGLEGAAQEVESPFQKDRTNHLSMVSFISQFCDY